MNIESKSIRLYLIDDHTMVRQGISALLAGHDDFVIVGESDDGDNVVENIRATHADVVLLDLSLPSDSGLDICRRITRNFRKVAVLVLTMHADHGYVAEALRNGARGYLLKESAADQLASAIRTVAGGEDFLGPGIDPSVLTHLTKIAEDDPMIILTSRERQVLKLIAKGQSNRVIAETLGVSVKTVDTHRWRMMTKLDIHDQTTLVKYAISKGLVQIPPSV